MRKVTVMVLAPGDAPVRTERIDADDYRELNRLVDGNLGTCSLPPQWRGYDYYAFCDDDAMIRPEPRPAVNRWAEHLGHYQLRGPIVIVKTDYLGETRTLTRADIASLEMMLAQEPSLEARRAAANEQAFWKEHPTGFVMENLTWE